MTLGVGFIGGPRGYTPKLVRSDYDFTVDTGSQAAYTVFTVTGNVLIHAIFGICEDAFTSGGVAKLELGVSGTTAVFIAQATATDLIVNEIWMTYICILKLAIEKGPPFGGPFLIATV